MIDIGRIKTTAVKTLANDLIKANQEKFCEEFEKNKKSVNELRPIKSKKIKNIVTGYITRRMKQINKSGL